jgi:hypothetical protein
MQAIQPIQPITADSAGSSTGSDIIILKFADSAVPVFKESKNKDYIFYGEDNCYPEYLTYLFNKSSLHNAIVSSKSLYTFGQGFATGDFTCNRLGESLNDVVKKAVLDVLLYGGFRFEVVYNAMGKVAEIYHPDYSSLRKGKEGGWLYAEEWQQFTKKGDTLFIPDFNPANYLQSQIFSYNEYRPSTKYYPLPDYIGANNYIETDIEISKFYLSAIRNGMMPSKLIQFFNGEPTTDKKGEIERRFKNKFTGSENAGNIILAFNNNATTPISVTDLSATDLDKMFIELNKQVQQQILSGHLVTSPMLFGIKTEGQLGGNTELRTAYELFNNTYAKPKADAISKEITYLLSYSIWPGLYELEPTEPVGNQIDIKDVLDIVPQSYIFKQLGIPEEDLVNVPVQPGQPGITAQPAAQTNEAIRNLTGRQQQQVERIIRKYKRRQLDEAAAKTLLRTGLGLSEEDINSLLGIQTAPRPGITGMSKVSEFTELNEDEIIQMFDACGEPAEDFEILKSKSCAFDIDDIEEDERIYKEAFVTTQLTATEAKIIDLIRKDPLITSDVIARTIGQSTALVESKIESLTKRGLIEATEQAVGIDTVIARTLTEPLRLPPTIIDGTPTTKIGIKYSYDGPEDEKNRPFCAKLMSLKRLYTRADIEKISARLGYSVWDRRGGFWTRKGTNITTPYCRHKWKSSIVIMKG